VEHLNNASHLNIFDQVLLETCHATTLLCALAILANKSGVDVLPVLPNLIRLCTISHLQEDAQNICSNHSIDKAS
jgi:hypothetical protein